MSDREEASLYTQDMLAGYDSHLTWEQLLATELRHQTPDKCQKIDGWMDEWMDQWMDGSTGAPHFFLYIL